MDKDKVIKWLFWLFIFAGTIGLSVWGILTHVFSALDLGGLGAVVVVLVIGCWVYAAQRRLR